MNDFINLLQAIYNVGKSLVLLLYVYLAAFFLVNILNMPDVFEAATNNAMEELEKISVEAKRRSEARY